LAIVSLE